MKRIWVRDDGWLEERLRHSSRKSGSLGLTVGQPGGLCVEQVGGAILVVVSVTFRCRCSFLWFCGWTCKQEYKLDWCL